MRYTEESARRIARLGFRCLYEYARAYGLNPETLRKGFQRSGVDQARLIVAERVRMTFEYAAEHGVSMRKAALATGWFNAATMRQSWKRLARVA